MKLKKSVLSFLACLLLLWVPQFANAASNEQKGIEEHVTVQVSKEEAQSFREEAGLPYDDSITGGFIVYPEGESTTNSARNEITPLEIGGNEYYVKNPSTSYRIDYNEPYLGASGCNMTLTATASFTKTTTLTGSVTLSASLLKLVTAQIGANFQVGTSKTVTASGSKAVTGCQTLKGYPRYEDKTGDLWEKDPIWDDYIGNYKATRLESIYFETRAM